MPSYLIKNTKKEHENMGTVLLTPMTPTPNQGRALSKITKWGKEEKRLKPEVNKRDGVTHTADRKTGRNEPRGYFESVIANRTVPV